MSFSKAQIAGSEVIKNPAMDTGEDEIPNELDKVRQVPFRIVASPTEDNEVNVTEEDEPVVVQRAQSSVKKFNTPKPPRKTRSLVQFGEIGRYLKSTRMNRVQFDNPKTLTFRSKSAEKIEAP